MSDGPRATSPTPQVISSTPAQRERCRRQGLEVLEVPAPLEEVFPRVAAIAHHGGVGLAQQALAAGRPQLLFPVHLEQLLNAQMLERLGVGPDVLVDELR